MHAKRTVIARAIATLVAAVVLVAGVPQTALAEEENPWSQWWSEVADRGTVAEIPLAIIFSIPAMICITSFWLGQLALDKIRGDDE